MEPIVDRLLDGLKELGLIAYIEDDEEQRSTIVWAQRNTFQERFRVAGGGANRMGSRMLIGLTVNVDTVMNRINSLAFDETVDKSDKRVRLLLPLIEKLINHLSCTTSTR
jgi:hypothetical protein